MCIRDSTAAGHVVVDSCQQQHAVRIGVFAGERQQFLFEILESQVDFEAEGVLAENLAGLLELMRVHGGLDLKLRSVHDREGLTRRDAAAPPVG